MTLRTSVNKSDLSCVEVTYMKLEMFNEQIQNGGMGATVTERDDAKK